MVSDRTPPAFPKFSTVEEERQHRKAILNVVVSLALGIAAAALGRLIGTQL